MRMNARRGTRVSLSLGSHHFFISSSNNLVVLSVTLGGADISPVGPPVFVKAEAGAEGCGGSCLTRAAAPAGLMRFLLRAASRFLSRAGRRAAFLRAELIFRRMPESMRSTPVV